MALPVSPEISACIRWKRDPVLFMIEVLGENPDFIWDKMREICYSVRDNRKTVVKAGHSVSKSYVAARIAIWYLYTHYPSTVFTTAPTHNQVENILWREIKNAKFKAKINLPGKVTTTGLDIGKTLGNGEEESKWFAIGFATKPDQGEENATKIQGLHNANFLAIFDEGCGIIHQIWEAKEALLTTESCRFLAIGNPTQATGDFVDCFSDPSYNKITVSVMDTPNYKQGKEVIPGVSGVDFVESMRLKYGEDSNQWKSRVIGEIPDIDEDSLLTLEWIANVEDNQNMPYEKTEKRFVTWDVADGGNDQHVIKSWKNLKEVDCRVLYNKKIEEAEPEVWRALRRLKGNTIIYDASGVGRVAGEYLELSRDEDTEIIGFDGSSKDVSDKTIYRNKRAEAHWIMRNKFRDSEISIMKNKDQRKELMVLCLKENLKGLIQMQSKDIIRKKLGRSPNHSDCIMMACGEYDNITPCDNNKNKKYKKETYDDNYSYMGV